MTAFFVISHIELWILMKIQWHIEEYNAHAYIYVCNDFNISIKKIENQRVKFVKALLFSDWCIIVCHFNEQNHRMREWLESKGMVSWSNISSQAGLPGAGCLRACWDHFLVSPRKEKEGVSWCSYGSSHILICSHCPWSCYWALLKRACLCLCTISSHIYIH